MCLVILFVWLFSGCRSRDRETVGKTPVARNESMPLDSLYLRCTPSTCSLFTITKSGKEAFLGESPPNSVLSAGPLGAIRIRSSCGSPCSNNSYFQRSNRKIEGPFPDVIEEDSLHRIIAYMETDSVRVHRLFKKNSDVIVHPEIGPVAAPVSAIQSATFKERSLIIEYLQGNQLDIVVGTIPLTPSFFTLDS